MDNCDSYMSRYSPEYIGFWDIQKKGTHKDIYTYTNNVAFCHCISLLAVRVSSSYDEN
jgi:hypothetical protein